MSLLVDFHETHTFSERFFLGPIGVFLRGTVEKQGKKQDPQMDRPILVNCGWWWNVIVTPTLGVKNECRCIESSEFQIQRFAKIKSEGRKKILQKHHLLTNLQYIHFQEAKFAKCFVEPLGKSEMVCLKIPACHIRRNHKISRKNLKNKK